MTAIEHSVVDKEDLIKRAKEAFKAVQKGSKLRDHYIKLVVMNNIMRAFVVAYKMPAEFQASQEALHAYETIIESSDEEMIAEMLEFVNYNREQGRWAIMKNK